MYVACGMWHGRPGRDERGTRAPPLLMKDGNNYINDKRLSLKLQRFPLVASLEMAPHLCCGASLLWVAPGGWLSKLGCVLGKYHRVEMNTSKSLNQDESGISNENKTKAEGQSLEQNTSEMVGKELLKTKIGY